MHWYTLCKDMYNMIWHQLWYIRYVKTCIIWINIYTHTYMCWYDTSYDTCIDIHQIMWHMCMSHITHMKDSCRTYEWVMARMQMNSFTHIDESCHTLEWVLSRTTFPLCFVEALFFLKVPITRNKKALYTRALEWIVSHTYEWVTSMCSSTSAPRKCLGFRVLGSVEA